MVLANLHAEEAACSSYLEFEKFYYAAAYLQGGI